MSEGVVEGVSVIEVMPTNMVEQQIVSEDDNTEPSAKRLRLAEHLTENAVHISIDQSVKQILFNINRAICVRLDKIESKLDTLTSRSRHLEDKVDQLIIRNHGNGNNSSGKTPGKKTVNVAGNGANRRTSGAVIVGLPQEQTPPNTKIMDDDQSDDDMNSQPGTPGDPNIANSNAPLASLGPNVTLITLNSEEDYPNGSWLGDENNPEMRVRVPITPSDMIHIHSNCRTSEKMALTLLDYLFDRDTQASSNLSGMGKYGKKQLDPLMIYGIRCHLIAKFSITEGDWHRIKLNIDSKCRTAFRRKQKGLPLTVKAFRGKAPPAYIHMDEAGQGYIQEHMQLNNDLVQVSQGSQEVDIQQAIATAFAAQRGNSGEMIQQGEIQVLHATPEQISQLQQAHHIQILQDGQIIQQVASDPEQELESSAPETVQVAVSMANEQDDEANKTADKQYSIVTETGEELSIDQSQDQVVDGEDDLGQDGNLVVTTEGDLIHIKRNPDHDNEADESP